MVGKETGNEAVKSHSVEKREGKFGVCQRITKDISAFQFLTEQASRQGCSQSTVGIEEL